VVWDQDGGGAVPGGHGRNTEDGALETDDSWDPDREAEAAHKRDAGYRSVSEDSIDGDDDRDVDSHVDSDADDRGGNDSHVDSHPDDGRGVDSHVDADDDSVDASGDPDDSRRP